MMVMKRQSNIKTLLFLIINRVSLFKKKKNYSQHPVKIVFNHSTPEFLQVKYQYNIKQTSDESKEKYYLGDEKEYVKRTRDNFFSMIPFHNCSVTLWLLRVTSIHFSIDYHP